MRSVCVGSSLVCFAFFISLNLEIVSVLLSMSLQTFKSFLVNKVLKPLFKSNTRIRITYVFFTHLISFSPFFLSPLLYLLFTLYFTHFPILKTGFYRINKSLTYVFSFPTSFYFHSFYYFLSFFSTFTKSHFFFLLFIFFTTQTIHFPPFLFCALSISLSLYLSLSIYLSISLPCYFEFTEEKKLKFN